jgi:TatD DNase family protein
MLCGLKGRNLLQMMPVERVLPETDGPFAQINGSPLLPWDAVSIDTDVATFWRMAPAEVRTQWTANLRNLVG